jgi:predicted PurR-regulated permease PerM
MKNHLPITWSARKVIKTTLLAAAVAAGFWLLYRFRLVLLILFTAIVLGTAFKPLVEWFHRCGISRLLSLVLVYLTVTLIFAGLLWISVPIFINQTLELADSIPQIYQNLRSTLLRSPSMILVNLGWNMPLDIRLILAKVPQDARSFDTVTRLITYTTVFIKVFLAVIAVFLLTSFWILESERSTRILFYYLPQQYRKTWQVLFEDIISKLGAFVRGQLFLSFVIGLLAYISYLMIGIPNAMVLALIAGVFEVVPIFGPALGALPAIFVAYSLDPSLILWVIGSTSIIQLLENYLLVPRIMGTSVGVNPIITLLVLATFTMLLGLPGALLAIPSAAIIQLILKRFVLSSDQSIWPQPSGRDKISTIRYEVHELIGDVRKQFRRKERRLSDFDDQIEDEIEAAALELDKFLKDSSFEEIAL